MKVFFGDIIKMGKPPISNLAVYDVTFAITIAQCERTYIGVIHNRVKAKTTSLLMGSKRIQFNGYIKQLQRSKKKLAFALAVI